MDKKKTLNYLKTKKLISSKEDKVSYIQIMGFKLIMLGIIGIILAAFLDKSSIIAISFFITMLGVAFAFPSLLEGNEGLSTMRIVVFMVVNVTCILLIKIGWGKDSLEAIGLNQYWMGVIAFVFGAKATQSYFESKFAVHKTETKTKQEASNTDQELFKKLSFDEQKRIVNDCILKEASELKNKFSEIQGFSARRKSINGLTQSYYCLHIDVVRKESNLNANSAIPLTINYKDQAGNEYQIPTDVTGVGRNILAFTDAVFTGDGEKPKQLGISCSRKGCPDIGTIGLKVFKNNIPYLLSCYHVLCAPEMKQGISKFTNSENPIVISPGFGDGVNYEEIAEVTEGHIDNFLDAAIAKLKNSEVLDNKYYQYNGSPQGTINLTSAHADQRIGVKLIGRSSGTEYGHLIDNYQSIIYMDNYPSGVLKDNQLFNLIITEKISKKGDSGATVVDLQNKVIGLLVGDNDIYSFVIPINTIINILKLDKF